VVGDEYIRITVFLAAVLFLVGIGSTFKLPTVRYVLICVGAVLLILATVLIAHQPGIPPNHHLAADRTRAIRDGCRAAFGDLPTRQVVIVDWPHPPVELVTIAATSELVAWQW
jgi:hypothetical protein